MRKTCKLNTNPQYHLLIKEDEKNLLVASMFALSACALLSSSCSNDSKPAAGTATAADKSELAAEGSSRETVLAQYVRYVDMARVQSGYTLFQEYAAADSAAQIKLASYHNQLMAPINKLAEEVQAKVQEQRYLSQASFDSDQARLNKMQQDAAGRFENRQIEFATQLSNMQKQIQDSLDSVVKDICAANGYDAILNNAAGLYFNPALDITEEVLTELNSRYKPASASK